MEATILAQKDLGTLIESQGKKSYFSFQGDLDTFNSYIKQELGVQDSNNIPLRESDSKPPVSKQNINTDVNKMSLSREGLAKKKKVPTATLR